MRLQKPYLSLAGTVLAVPALSSPLPQSGPEVLARDRPEYNQTPAGTALLPREEETPADGRFFMQAAPDAAGAFAVPDEDVRIVAPTVDRERLYFGTHEGVEWVRGKTYKASVAPGGFRYIPFLGSDAPRSYPVTFRLTEAAIGDRSLELTPTATVRNEGTRMVLDRGPVEVIYDFAVESVEQSFALDVAGSVADLTLVLDVSTELQGRAEIAGFSFSNALGGMRYGDAVVLDGAGRRASVDAVLSGGQITLTVPRTFLMEATGQVIVDPILDTFVVDAVSGFQRDVELGYDVSSDSFLYAYEDQFSGTDIDIYVTPVSASGVTSTGGYAELGSANWTDPNVATLNASDVALVVATSDAGGTRSIVGRIWNFSTSGFTTGDLQISSVNPSVPQFGADVGGNSTSTAGSRFMVVWNADFGPDTDIQGRTVTDTGVLGSTVFLDSSTLDDSTDVTISESTGNPSTVNRWNVAYINRELSSNVYAVHVAQLDALGGVVEAAAPVVTLPAGDSIGEIDVSDALPFASGGIVYAVAYDQFSTIEEDTFIVFCRGNDLVNTVELQRSEHADLARDQALARLATTYEEFVVSYLEQSPAGPYEGYLTAFDFTEGLFLSISERRVPLGAVAPGSSYTQGGGVALASRFSGGNTTSRILGAGWDVGTTDLDVAGVTYFASNGDSPAFQYCYGNVNSTGDRGFIRLDGSRSTTSAKTMIATALPTNAFGYFIVGDAFASVANPGGSSGVLCVGGSVGRYSNFVTSSGSAGRISVTFDPTQISQPGGSVAGMAGQEWQFSLWHRDSAGGMPTSNFTNAVSIFFE